jgi:hypothetical protein
MRVPFSPHPPQHLLLLVFFMVAILTGLRGNLNVVLICISFMAKAVEHFFMCFFFGHIPLKKLCSAYLPVSSLVIDILMVYSFAFSSFLSSLLK